MSWYKTFHTVKLGKRDILCGVTVWMSSETRDCPAEYEIEDVQPVDKIYSFVVNECKADIIQSLYEDTTFIFNDEDLINA